MKRFVTLMFLLFATVLTVKAEGKMTAVAGGVRHLGGENYRLYLSLSTKGNLLQGVKKEDVKLYGEWDKESEIDFEIASLQENYVPAHYSLVIDNQGILSGGWFGICVEAMLHFIENAHEDDIFSFYPIVENGSPIIEGVDRISALLLLGQIKAVEKYDYRESSLMMATAYNTLLKSEDERRKIIILSGNVMGRFFPKSSDYWSKLREGDVMVSSVFMISHPHDMLRGNERYSKLSGGKFAYAGGYFEKFPGAFQYLKEQLDNYYVVDFKLPINEQVSGEMQITVEKDGLTGSCKVIVNGGG